MSNTNTIRWVQRLDNYQQALVQLQAAVSLSKTRDLSDLEKLGLIQAFEFTHELAWNVIKDYFAYQGNTNITGSRDAVREAFKQGLLIDGEGWMEMIKSRNQSSLTYNLTIANEIVLKINTYYITLFSDFYQTMGQHVSSD